MNPIIGPIVQWATPTGAVCSGNLVKEKQNTAVIRSTTHCVSPKLPQNLDDLFRDVPITLEVSKSKILKSFPSTTGQAIYPKCSASQIDYLTGNQLVNASIQGVSRYGEFFNTTASDRSSVPSEEGEAYRGLSGSPVLIPAQGIGAGALCQVGTYIGDAKQGFERMEPIVFLLNEQMVGVEPNSKKAFYLLSGGLFRFNKKPLP